MAPRTDRIRTLLRADTSVTPALVPSADIVKDYFGRGDSWEVPGVLIGPVSNPLDVQTNQQDLMFRILVFGKTGTLADALYQAVRTALTAQPEYGVRSPDDETAHKAVLVAVGIRWITEEVGGQSLTEPQSGRRGDEVVAGTFRAIFTAT